MTPTGSVKGYLLHHTCVCVCVCLLRTAEELYTRKFTLAELVDNCHVLFTHERKRTGYGEAFPTAWDCKMQHHAGSDDTRIPFYTLLALVVEVKVLGHSRRSLRFVYTE
jgi:hypothetical protein